MEAKCLAIAHAELGGIAVHRAAHRRPHLLENRTMTSNMMSSPPADRAHLACQEESWACATVLCGVPREKDVMAVKRVRVGGRWGARIGNPLLGTLLICHSSPHFLMAERLGGRPAQLDLVDRNSVSPAKCR